MKKTTIETPLGRVTVRAPAESMFRVRKHMASYAAVALEGLCRSVDDRGARSTADKKVNSLQIMEAGLGEEKFSEFCDFVRGALTQNRYLAFVGAGEPLTAETWQTPGTEEIIGVFADFAIQAEIQAAKAR